MRILMSCRECAFSGSNTDRELLYADLTEDQVVETTCRLGHRTRTYMQANRFEILLEFGAMALLDGYYREAVATFAAALERFLEFYIRTVCIARAIDHGELTRAWKDVANQSERQTGAFLFLYLLEEGVPARLVDDKMIKIRNAVVHKGKLSSGAEAKRYAAWVYQLIVDVGTRLRAKHYEASSRASFLASLDGGRRQPSGTLAMPMLLSWIVTPWPQRTFAEALDDLADRRSFVWSAPSAIVATGTDVDVDEKDG